MIAQEEDNSNKNPITDNFKNSITLPSIRPSKIKKVNLKFKQKVHYHQPNKPSNKKKSRHKNNNQVQSKLVPVF